jgi:hypothetical protein
MKEEDYDEKKDEKEKARWMVITMTLKTRREGNSE